MHANITEAMVSNCNVPTGYHTYPHIDMDSTAVRGAKAFFAMLQGKANPVLRWGNAPMLPHVMRQGTDDEPNATLQNRAMAMESAGSLGVSVFTGFPHADIYDAGFSVVAMTDGDCDAAEAQVNELLGKAWEQREAFVYEIEPLPQSMQRAKEAAAGQGDGPVIVLDHYDNTASGGTMDTTEVLRCWMGPEQIAVFGFMTPSCGANGSRWCWAKVTVELGGKLPMPALTEQSQLTVTGEVQLISNGKFQAQWLWPEASAEHGQIGSTIRRTRGYRDNFPTYRTLRSRVFPQPWHGTHGLRLRHAESRIHYRVFRDGETGDRVRWPVYPDYSHHF